MTNVEFASHAFATRMSKPETRLPPLDLLVAFEAVARRGSVTAGAAERFITQSAMSRQIQALEAALGTPLFQRRHRALAAHRRRPAPAAGHQRCLRNWPMWSAPSGRRRRAPVWR